MEVNKMSGRPEKVSVKGEKVPEMPEICKEKCQEKCQENQEMCQKIKKKYQES